MKILIADDFETMRFVLRTAIKKLAGEVEIVEVTDGKQAIEKLKEAFSAGQPFSHLFCDWNMPNTTGLEVLEYCRGRSDLDDLVFVMVTAESETHNVVLALKTGANQFIAKPISSEDLRAKLHKILALDGDKK